MMQNKKTAIIFISAVVFIVLSRTLFHIAPNIEFVTVTSLAFAYFIENKKLALLVPIVGMILSDMILGNTSIFMFTWSGFLIVPVLAFVAKKIKTSSIGSIAFKSQMMALLSTIVFFLWTNFGVVLVTNLYTKNVEGVIQSYINALPFLRNQLLFNLVITPLTFVAITLLLNQAKAYRVRKNIITNN